MNLLLRVWLYNWTLNLLNSVLASLRLKKKETSLLRGRGMSSPKYPVGYSTRITYSCSRREVKGERDLWWLNCPLRQGVDMLHQHRPLKVFHKSIPECPSMWRLAVTRHLCEGNFQALPLGARWGQREQPLQASLTWFHCASATEMSGDFLT